MNNVESVQQAITLTIDQALQQAIFHHQAGRLQDAEHLYRAILQTQPNHPDANHNLGVLAVQVKHPAVGLPYLKVALEANPSQGQYWVSYIDALIQAEQPDTAQRVLDQGRKQGLNDEAVEVLARRLEEPSKNEPSSQEINSLVALFDEGRFTEAATLAQAMTVRFPLYGFGWKALGAALNQMGLSIDALEPMQKAVFLLPRDAVAHSNLGLTLHEMGRLDEAEAAYQQAIQINSDTAETYSNLLLSFNYDSRKTPSFCLKEARQFGQIISGKVTSRFLDYSCTKQSKRLRVGLVSGDLNDHPVSYFLENMLAHLDQSKIDLFAYPTHLRTDALTTRIKPFFGAWKPLFGKSDEAAAQLIHADAIHILVDLSGHTAGNRLPIFAWKPAPVQVSWLGYFATTGVAEIDYLIADPWVLPEAEEAFFTEKIWRLPETRLCFSPPDVGVKVSPLPALSNKYITFGCFNKLAKMNDDVVKLWARLLLSVPDSRLLLKNRHLVNESMQKNTFERFAAHGIGANRLVLEFSEPREKYLAAYHRVDIALDPFPYPGGTTSVESLWMGVPVLTLAGERFLSRQGVGLLMNAGLPEWIAADADDYIARAVFHASDIHRLASLRNGLRQQILASPIFDAPRFARHFEAALRGMWARWCDQQQERPS